MKSKDEVQKELDICFTALTQDNSVLMTMAGVQKEELAKQLNEYKMALMAEVAFLSTKNDHYSRIKDALEALNDPHNKDSFLLHLENFNKESQNTNCYLETKLLAASIVTLLVLLPLSLLLAVALGGSSLMMSTIINIVALPTVLGLIIYPYKPVFDVREQGNKLFNFFSDRSKEEQAVLRSSEASSSPLVDDRSVEMIQDPLSPQ